MEQQAKAPADLKKVADFLRSGSAGMKVRVGALNGKRVDYFKGKSAVKALLSPAYQKKKGMPAVTNEAEAMTVLHAVHTFAFYIRVQRFGPSGSSSSSPKTLQIMPEQKWAQDEYYAWFYDGSQWTTYAGGVLMVAIMLGGVMFPLWPPVMRLGVWYLSIGMLGLIALFFVIAILRLVFYIITVLLFADVGFVESFIPLWEWDLPKKKGKKRRSDKGKEKEKTGVATATEMPPIESRTRIEEVADEDDA
ncbi:translocation protein [Mucidula mucida]|nr:translocation protein [Mucidula mucida]